MRTQNLKMACYGRSSISQILTAILLASVILPDFLLAVPVTRRLKDDGMAKADTDVLSKRLIRNRRNISWYKQHSDFWNWYKFFSDNGNQDGVAQLDRVYLAYLQNKNRAEAQRSYKLYLQHLGEIYKSCAESDNPNCVASYTSRQKVSGEPPKPAPVKSCDPYRDPYCLSSRGYTLHPYIAPSSVKSPAPAPAPAQVKSPAYVRSPVMKQPISNQFHHAPMVQSFLSPEQKAELFHICGAEDVECLQYHLRGAYGYKPASVPAPSYTHLGCDPNSDPYCVQKQVQKSPAGMYLQYPSCDPRVDPYCTHSASQRVEAPSAPSSLEKMCNPLFDDNCNPLTATRFSRLASASKKPKDASPAGAMLVQPNQHYDPYAMYQDAAASSALHRPPPATHQHPQHIQPPSMDENVHPLGPPGKTKEGYDCFIGYDEECYPVGAQSMPSVIPIRKGPYTAEAYEPHLYPDGARKGVIEPDPDCDPEYDRNCRLRRYEPETEATEVPALHMEQNEQHRVQEHRDERFHHVETPQHREELSPEQQSENQGYDQQQYDRYMSGQEDPYAPFGPPEQGGIRVQDMMEYGVHFPGQDDYRTYTGEYKKK